MVGSPAYLRKQRRLTGQLQTPGYYAWHEPTTQLELWAMFRRDTVRIAQRRRKAATVLCGACQRQITLGEHYLHVGSFRELQTARITPMTGEITAGVFWSAAKCLCADCALLPPTSRQLKWLRSGRRDSQNTPSFQ